MQRIFILTSLVLGSLAAGCVADSGDESFVIQGVLSPPEGAACAFTPSAAGPFISRGFSGLNTTTFLIEAQFESRVQAAEGKESLRTIFVEGANVELRVSPMIIIENNVTRFDDSTEQTIQFQTLFSSALPPNAGLSAAAISLIPPDIMASIRLAAGPGVADRNVSTSIEVDATITAFGDFYGDRLDSTPFTFASDITNQNIINLGTCPLPATTAVPDPITGCINFGQNVDACCVDATAGVVCPPTFEQL